MHPIEASIRNPVKVTVGVLLVALFGVIALLNMPMQLTPEVQIPTITVQTRWFGASPQEVEREIVQEQEEHLKSVEGVTKMSSECKDSVGEIKLEFAVGTNMAEALLKVNSRLQQVSEYPEDADEPVISTSNSSDRPIAWFILSARPASNDAIRSFQASHPQLREELQTVLDAHNMGLAVLRLRRLAEKHPEVQPLLPPDINVPQQRKFAQDHIEAEFERVPGVADSNVYGGQDPEFQVVIDPHKLAARGLSIMDVRRALENENKNTSGGDIWEGKRRYVVRTLGQFRSPEQVANVILSEHEGQYVYLRDVTIEGGVRLGYKKPDGFVRRFGVSNIAVNAQRETGANVYEVMDGLKRATRRLNDGILKKMGLVLTQVYDETEYITSAVGLVKQNIILGGSLTVIVLMLFLNLSLRTLVIVPLLAGSAVAAILISPWLFLGTLAVILIAGVWFARGALVVTLAIPISIIGTFLVLNMLGRSLNVISLAGLAFAVGMLVDNAVVVLENIYRHYQAGARPFDAARRATIEVWGAVVASTVTTLFVFLPIVFMEEEAGQLFRDIALAISAAVGFSLLVSVTVIPTASARILPRRREDESSTQSTGIVGSIARLGRGFVAFVVGLNRRIQQGLVTRIAVVLVLIGSAGLLTWALWPKVEYLPLGNRNLVFCIIMPPAGYNLDKMMRIGAMVEDELRPYWDVDPTSPEAAKLDTAPIGDFFYVARGRQVFMGLRSTDPTRAYELVDLVQKKFAARLPGTLVVAAQSSLFGRGLEAGRNIDIEITGPELEHLVAVGGQIMGQVMAKFPQGTQARPKPSLDLSTPELHVTPRTEQAAELGIRASELGYTVNALVDGAYATDYFIGGDKIDLVILGDENWKGHTQDIEQLYVATSRASEPVRLDTIASIDFGAGPEQINHRERRRAITISVTPPDDMPLAEAIDKINAEIINPLTESGQLGADYTITLSGTADKLRNTWNAMKWNLLLAVLITYLLMAALFESWVYPLVIILSVPLGAVGGVLGLALLNAYLGAMGWPLQALDVLTMLGFVILIGTVVNNAILIVHQSLNHMRHDHHEPKEAILESVRTRIRPIFMTTLTTCFGLAPLVLFPGAGAELYRGLGAVVLGGLIVSTIFTLILVPTLFSLMMDAVDWYRRLIRFEERSFLDEELALSRDEQPVVADQVSQVSSRQIRIGHESGDDQEPMLNLDDELDDGDGTPPRDSTPPQPR